MLLLNKLLRSQLSISLCSHGFSALVWQQDQDVWCELDKIPLGIKGNTSCLHVSKCKFECQNKNQRLSLKPSKKSYMYGYFICILYGPHLHVTPNETIRGHQSPWNWFCGGGGWPTMLVLWIKPFLKSRNGCAWWRMPLIPAWST